MKENSEIKIIKIPAGRANCYIIKNGKDCLMIDAGYSGLNKMINIFKDNEIDFRDILMLVLTHTHIDHTNLLYDLNKKIYSEILVHEAGEKYLKFGQTPAPKSGSIIGKSLLFLDKIGGNNKYTPVVPDTVINSDFYTNRLGFDMNIVPTPGHTMDSLTITINEKFAFVGDTLFNVFPWSIYPFFVEDKALLKKSWKKLLDMQCDYYFPGHGEKIPYEKLKRHYDRLK